LRKFEPGRAAGQDIDRLALEFQLYEVPEVYAGAMFFPWDRSAEVLRAWLDWTRTVPDEVTSVGRMLQFPPLPVVPEPLRGQSFAVLELVFLGDKAEGDELTEPLRARRPVMDTIRMVPPAGIAELHMDPRADALRRRGPAARQVRRGRDRRLRGRGRPGLGPRWCLRRSGTSAGHSRARRQGKARSVRSTASS